MHRFLVALLVVVACLFNNVQSYVTSSLFKSTKLTTIARAKKDIDAQYRNGVPIEQAIAAGNVVRSGEGKDLDHMPVVDDEDLPDMDPIPNAKPSVDLPYRNGVPIEQAIAAGNVVRSGEGRPLDHMPVVDDEDLPDMDPIPNAKPSLDLPYRNGVPIERAIAANHVVRSGEGKELDHMPVVDDEDLPDMDPMHNVKPNLDYVDFDAPLERRIAVGDIVKSGEGKELDHMPVVDDEELPDMDPMHPDGGHPNSSK